MTITIQRVDQALPSVQDRVRQYLAPHEAHTMFILGNLGSSRPAELYVAADGDRWLGVCGFYATFSSLVPFSTDPKVVQSLVSHVVAVHPDIAYLNGIDYAAAPAVELLLSLGYQLRNDPHMVFMELDGLPPQQPAEPLCQPFLDVHAEQAARLLHVLQGKDPDVPASAEDVQRVRANKARWVILQDGAVVSTAATSGLGIAACQIIGVATHPNYRRHGYAAALCAHVIRQMAARGATRSILFTPHDNLPAQACYRRLGFRITGEYCMARFN